MPALEAPVQHCALSTQFQYLADRSSFLYRFSTWRTEREGEGGGGGGGREGGGQEEGGQEEGGLKRPATQRLCQRQSR
jgi:hypothetical protein